MRGFTAVATTRSQLDELPDAGDDQSEPEECGFVGEGGAKPTDGVPPKSPKFHSA